MFTVNFEEKIVATEGAIPSQRIMPSGELLRRGKAGRIGCGDWDHVSWREGRLRVGGDSLRGADGRLPGAHGVGSSYSWLAQRGRAGLPGRSCLPWNRLPSQVVSSPVHEVRKQDGQLSEQLEGGFRRAKRMG